MTSDQAKQLREEFLSWSGGFTPDEMDSHDVEDWLEDREDEAEVRAEIERWMAEEAQQD
jgi:hypothetical protein